MTPATGLRTYIWNNDLKSGLLLAGFPILLLMLAYAGALVFVAAAGTSEPVIASSGDWLGNQFAGALDLMPGVIPWVAIAVAVWFAIAWFTHQKIIDLATGARPVTRKDEPELYNLLENLCISRGLTMPDLRVVETEAPNAYASGLHEKQYSITVTRGLMERLDREELEAVLAHELTHIRNHDVRLLVIAIIFVGIISFIGEIVARTMFRSALYRAGGARRGRGGNMAVVIVIAAVIVALAYFLAIVLRFAVSREREFMADAGAVELTKNPDAMISALRKIAGGPRVDKATPEVRQMFLHDRPEKADFTGMFATHPPIEKRIEALVKYAGGRDEPPTPPQGAVPAV